MAFVKVNKSKHNVTEGNAVLTMGAYLGDGKVHKSRSVAFRFTRTLMEQLGWIRDGRVGLAMYEGTDKDAGFLQITPEPDGYTLVVNNRGSSNSTGGAISVTADRFKHYVLNECPVSTCVAQHSVDGNSLIIECPEWLRFNPESVPKPTPVAPPPPIQLHPQGKRQRR